MNMLHDHYPRTRIYSIDGLNYRLAMTRFLSLPPRVRERFQLIKGHMFFGAHRCFSAPATYFTMLREPTSRILSLYNYYLQLHRNKPPGVAHMTLEDFLKSGKMLVADNGMARLLAGADHSDVPYGSCGRDIADAALANLEQHIPLVGLLERFDESLLLYKNHLGWKKMPFYARKNTTSQVTLTLPRISTREREAMHPYMQWDKVVYEAAKEMFSRKLAAEGDEFTELLDAFRNANEMYRRKAGRSPRRQIRRVTDALNNRNLFSWPHRFIGRTS